MIENIIRLAIVFVVLLLLWYGLTLVAASMGIPVVVVNAVGLILILIFALYAVRALGVS